MPAIITHHIFGEDVLRTLPAGMVEGEEEVLAFLLGNQGPDPLFARFSTAPSVAVRCRRLGHAMHDGRVVEAAFAMRDGVSHLPVADERVGRAFALGALGHYALDRTAHPFVFAQQEALAAAEPSLAGAGSELHAVIESDIDSWILWEKRPRHGAGPSRRRQPHAHRAHRPRGGSAAQPGGLRRLWRGACRRGVRRLLGRLRA